MLVALFPNIKVPSELRWVTVLGSLKSLHYDQTIIVMNRVRGWHYGSRNQNNKTMVILASFDLTWERVFERGGGRLGLKAIIQVLTKRPRGHRERRGLVL